MTRQPLSLKNRQLIIFVGIVVLLLPAIFVSIEQAFKQSQVKALEQQLEANLYTLIGEIDLDAQSVEISSASLPPIFNQGSSGTLAVIEQNQHIVWRSDSALGQNVVISSRPPSPGEKQFGFVDGYWRYSYGLFYESEQGTRNLMIHVMQAGWVLQDQVEQFRHNIIIWFAVIAIVLILAMSAGLWSTLSPLKQLDAQIKQVEKGESQFIEGQYPKELASVKEDLNLLIQAQERQKNRYRSSLSDLTHALKTPVAVLRSSSVCDEPVVLEQLDRMTGIIEHQLRKAATGGEDLWKKKTAVNPVVDKLMSVMRKIYADKALALRVDMDEDCHFYGDEADLMEILGNLIDNACKACNKQIAVIVRKAQGLSLTVEDDGPGIAPEHKELLLVRGQRLDSYSDGHGVGMAIVSDLVNSYHGELHILDSTLGGAKFVVHFTS